MPRRSWFRKLQMRNLTFGRRNHHVNVNLIQVQPRVEETTKVPGHVKVSTVRRVFGRFLPFLFSKNKVAPAADGAGDSSVPNNGEVEAELEAGKEGNVVKAADDNNNGQDEAGMEVSEERSVDKAAANNIPIVNTSMLGEPSPGKPQVVNQRECKESYSAHILRGLGRLNQILPFYMNILQPYDLEPVLDAATKDPVILGRGSFGSVVLAYRRDDPRALVAVKHIPFRHINNQWERDKILLEARVMSMMQSFHYYPDIYGVFEDFVQPKGFSIVMEFVSIFQGLQTVSVEKLCNNKAGNAIVLSSSQFIDIVEEITRGLKLLHTYGLLHNDIAGRNIMLCHTYSGVLQAKIVDFGLVCAIDAPLSRNLNYLSDFELQRCMQNNPEIAPELLAGALPSVETDIFALGTVIKSIANFSKMVALGRIADKCRAYDPNARSSLNEVLEDIEFVQDNTSYLNLTF